MPDFYLMLILEVLLMMVTFILVLIVSKFPFVLKLLFAKSCVFEIQESGNMLPVKSRSIAGAMITKSGTYNYTKKDTLRWCGISSIIAHRDSDARALNPDIMPVLSLLRKVHVDSLEDIECILKSPVISKEDYEKTLSKKSDNSSIENTPGSSENMEDSE